jgi:uncharacterized protein (UPF0332 family)
MAYNAILQALRALIYAMGFRPRRAEQHATVALFARQCLGDSHRQQVEFFDQMRRKRHRVMYDQAELIGGQEARQALDLAGRFVKDIRAEIARRELR